VPDEITVDPLTVFSSDESGVRSYLRLFPALFATAKDEFLVGADGTRYLDFFAGAGALNYGHNPDVLKQALLDYLADDGVTHGLDFATTAKAAFLEVFRTTVLAPRGLDYRVQFCSPSGANAVEAALKLARLATGRTTVVAFCGGFHGVSTGALAATGSEYFRQGLSATLPHVVHVPYPDSPMGPFDSLDLLRRLVLDTSSGVERPAAVLLETVQAEGGVYLAPTAFLSELRDFCDRHGIVLVVDDIQAGCGRTGTFFSFERAGITPDLVTLSKSISGYGLPMALLLIAPKLDVWQPGQHSGTFRGNQLAFVAAAAALRSFWVEETFAADIRRKGQLVGERLTKLCARLGASSRGTGLIWGLDLSAPGLPTAEQVSKACFEAGLIVETCGRRGEVLKLLPPLTIGADSLIRGLDVIENAVTSLPASRQAA
jgi:diaminobutyrate-2-oxoglutarate transaminase